MWYIVLFFAALAVFLLGCKTKIGKNSDKEDTIAKTQIIDENFTEGNISLKLKQDIVNRLKLLKNSPPPTELAFGAMCYEMGISQHEFSYTYICPKCNEKTIFNYKDEASYELSSIVKNINQLRKEVEKIKGYDISLKESGFCRHCDSTVKTPCLDIKIRLSIDSTYSTIHINKMEDFTLMREFLSGSTKHKGEQDDESPLVNYLERLEKLFEVKL